MSIVEGIEIITDEECEKLRQDIIKREEERIKTNYYTGEEIMSLDEINAEIDAYRKGL